MTDARRRRWPRGWVLLVAVAVGAYGGAVTEALAGLLWREPWNWAEWALRGLGPAIGSGVVYALQDVGLFPTREARLRREGSPDTAGAIATGILPPDADPERWRPWLELERRELNQVRWLTVALWVPGGVLVAIAGAVADDGAWGVWALAAALIAFGLRVFHRLTRRVDRVRRLLDELTRRA